ncbi:hypothetical protein [Pseudoclavibacter sp. AY1H1]|uniref:hypothetical protein n=1 Tax=Pseudoclavibacter sp. AY1H1 TaxID=2080584 RepID=UPI000CE80276|nr:hypothetical protein [Pseudoclavibacter sp. AY1H1]PPF39975.1 hypothetical protein C5E05_01820 [Pseudoclavibacter sp. AY1H1]
MTTNALNALIFGSDNDSVYLGPVTSLTTVVGLATPVPAALEDRGWIGEEGLNLELSDSIERIKGHQGGKTVKTFMSSSDTNITVALLETKLANLLDYLSAKATKVGTGNAAIAKIDVPASRQVTMLSGMIDLFDTSGNGAHTRILLPTISLGERQGIAFTNKDITAYNYNLEVIGGFTILTNAKAIVEDPKLLAA